MFHVDKIEKVNKSKANVPMTVRFPEDVYNDYKKLSEESNQSFNSIVISALRYALQDLENLKFYGHHKKGGYKMKKDVLCPICGKLLCKIGDDGILQKVYLYCKRCRREIFIKDERY